MDTITLSGNPMHISTPTPVTTHTVTASTSRDTAPQIHGQVDVKQPLQERNTTDSIENNTKTEIEKLRQSTVKFNQMSDKLNLDIKFAYNEKIDQVYLNVIDKHTGQVIRKLPSEEAMKISETMKELVGNLLDKKG